MNDTTNKTIGAAHLTEADFDSTLKNEAGKPVFVDFYAEWCGPCKAAAPIVEKLAAEYADQVIVAKVDVDASHDIAAKFGVMSIPTVLVFKNGEVVDTLVGFAGESGYRRMLDKVATVSAK
jgi:thioredoxin 1